ncbi:Rne/Rng family ribonuclease [Antribacter sp. KLBMP9083]|uniref:Ribonuclease E n=1 Tax=Antribacter soli TaxID=2910976 RepID=A0AA41U729_9MICO|nr:Rne/Rng family ribonuclease [Antribacter soli]MCF4121648.1 Rne/Rng family ribonuclease [Antribacter soli]
MTPRSTTNTTIGSQNDHDEALGASAEAEETTKRTPRRRATRATAAPPKTEPVFLTAETATTPITSASTAEPVVVAGTGTGDAPRKSRRAVRVTAAPEAVPAPAPAPVAETPAEPETPADLPADLVVELAVEDDVAAPAAVVSAEPEPEPEVEEPAIALHDIVLPERRTPDVEGDAREVRSLDDIVLPAGPRGAEVHDAEAEAAPAEPAEKPARSRRRTKKTEAEPAETPAAEPAEAPARRSRRRAAAPVAEAPVTEAASEAEVIAAPEAEPAEDTAAEAAPAPRTRRATRGRAARAEAPAEPAPSPEPAAEPAEAPISPAATTGGSRKPRLATTALLFQAPDPTTARRPRRAVAPAGPPRPHEEPAEAVAPAQAEPTRALTTQAAEPPAETLEAAPTAHAPLELDLPASRLPAAEAPAPRTRSRRASRGAAAPTPTEAPAVDTASALEAIADTAERARAAAPQFLAAETSAIELSEDEAAAVEEVGLIESELLAEGVELEELAPEDFEEDEEDEDGLRPARRRRRRGGRGRRGGRDRRDSFDEGESDEDEDAEDTEAGDAEATDETGATGPASDSEAEGDEGDDEEGEGGSRRRRRRRRGTRGERAEAAASRTRERAVVSDEVTALKGSTRLEAKRQRRREGRDAGRRRQIITEAEFLARRESVTRSMIVREKDGRTQIAVLEDGVLVEHYVSQQSQTSMAGNVYLGRVQNVLPSMEAAFVDVGKGRNAVLYAGEVNWDAAGLEGQPRRIEQALKSGDSVLVQVTKDPIGHKGARLTSQVTLAGRYLVFVPGGGMTGISRKLPDIERNRLKKILREVVPEGAGVIVRTAAEGASEEELRADVERLQNQWAQIEKKAKTANAPALLQGEPDLAIRVVRDIFNDDFSSLVVEGDGAWDEISSYVDELAPDLRERVSRWAENTDVFAVHRVDEQLSKGMDRKVWLPSGGSLVIDRTEAMTVVDVNTGKFTGAGGTLEETVTRNNLEAAEEIVRQLRLRDIGGIIVIDFIDMVLESNRDLVLRRLVECLGRDRTKHQVAEVTSLGLVQMTRKRVGQGLVEAFSETCEHCHGRGFIVHEHPIERGGAPAAPSNGGGAVAAEAEGRAARSRRKRGGAKETTAAATPPVPVLPDERSEAREAVKATLATIAAAAAHAHEARDVDGVVEQPADLIVEAATVDADAAEAFVEDAVSGAAEAVEPVAEGAVEPVAAEAEEAAVVGQGDVLPKGAGDDVA